MFCSKARSCLHRYLGDGLPKWQELMKHLLFKLDLVAGNGAEQVRIQAHTFFCDRLDGAGGGDNE